MNDHTYSEGLHALYISFKFIISQFTIIISRRKASSVNVDCISITCLHCLYRRCNCTSARFNSSMTKFYITNLNLEMHNSYPKPAI